MNRPLRRFLFTLLAVWILLGSIAAYLAPLQHISLPVAGRILPAFLLEAAAYLLLGLEDTRDWLIERWPPRRLALALWLSALAPYVAYALGTGTGSWQNLAIVAGVAACLCGWFVVLPRGTATDLLFLLSVVPLFLYRPLSHVYGTPIPHLDLNALGRITYIRTAILAVLLLRRLPDVHASFLPNAREWRVGLVHYAAFLPVGFVLFQLLPLGQWRPWTGDWEKLALIAVGNFLAFLMGLALWEEFFCRGYLQQIVGKGVRSDTAGWLLASAVFGLVHLWFRHFPNWNWVLLATILGLFCGHAYWRTHSIRSSMVTHALVVATWRVLFV